MSDHRPAPEPGERPPSRASSGGQLDAAPSDRYRRSDATEGRGGPPERPGPGARPLVGALLTGAVGAALLIGIVAVLAETTGTIFVSGLAGAVIGLLVATTAVPAAQGTAPARARASAVRLAVGIAIGMVVIAAAGIWLISRVEGGVMDPLSYLWTTLGLGIPLLGLVAGAAAAWGAASGPIRRGG